jgi:hypothetical protein
MPERLHSTTKKQTALDTKAQEHQTRSRKLSEIYRSLHLTQRPKTDDILYFDAATDTLILRVGTEMVLRNHFLAEAYNKHSSCDLICIQQKKVTWRISGLYPAPNVLKKLDENRFVGSIAMSDRVCNLGIEVKERQATQLTLYKECNPFELDVELLRQLQSLGKTYSRPWSMQQSRMKKPPLKTTQTLQKLKKNQLAKQLCELGCVVYDQEYSRQRHSLKFNGPEIEVSSVAIPGYVPDSVFETSKVRVLRKQRLYTLFNAETQTEIIRSQKTQHAGILWFNWVKLAQHYNNRSRASQSKNASYVVIDQRSTEASVQKQLQELTAIEQFNLIDRDRLQIGHPAFGEITEIVYLCSEISAAKIFSDIRQLYKKPPYIEELRHGITELAQLINTEFTPRRLATHEMSEEINTRARRVRQHLGTKEYAEMTPEIRRLLLTSSAETLQTLRRSIISKSRV